MKFDEKHPNAGVNDVILFEGDEYIYSAKVNPCWDCGTPTRWYSTGFMYAPLCSETCSRHKWNEYFEAERQAQIKETRYSQIRKELGYDD